MNQHYPGDNCDEDEPEDRDHDLKVMRAWAENPNTDWKARAEAAERELQEVKQDRTLQGEESDREIHEMRAERDAAREALREYLKGDAGASHHVCPCEFEDAVRQQVELKPSTAEAALPVRGARIRVLETALRETLKHLDNATVGLTYFGAARCYPKGVEAVWRRAWFDGKTALGEP